MAQQRGFWQGALAWPRKECISCARDSSNVQQSCLGAKKWPGWNFKQQLFSNMQQSIWCRSDGFAAYENEIQASCFFASVSSLRIVATLHITFSWLPLPIGQVCSQVWCRPCLAAYFGFFDLRTIPWSLSQVQVSTFYPFTPKVGSKCTYIILTSSSVKPSIDPQVRVITAENGPDNYKLASKKTN